MVLLWLLWRLMSLGKQILLSNKVEICHRAFKLLTEKAQFPPERYHFRSKYFAIGTGIKEHDRYALNFIEAAQQIKNCPEVKISGGIEQCVFCFWGNDRIREAMHSVFSLSCYSNRHGYGNRECRMIKFIREIDPKI